MGFGLNLDREQDADARAKEREAEMGDAVMITFKLPDGTEKPHKFNMGQSIGFLKATIESEYGIKIPTQALMLNDKVLIDPMSLADYPEIIAANGAVIVVKVS